jgi:quercetin dioxygenase-like cupin family protein
MSYFIELRKLSAFENLQHVFMSSVQTENLAVAFTEIKSGIEIPLYHQPEEAVYIPLEGTLEMTIGNNSELLAPGIISIVPPNTLHSAKAITNCNVITVFYPQRKI